MYCNVTLQRVCITIVAIEAQQCILISTTVEWYLHLPLCGDLLGPRTFWNTWKWNCRWTRKGGFCSPVIWTRAALGVSRQNIKINCWLINQHMTLWQILTSTQRQARELISGPSLAAKTRLLSFNRTQCRVVSGLFTGHNTLRKHLYIMGLTDSPLCRRCWAEEETSTRV
jgi:hypothetical protein